MSEYGNMNDIERNDSSRTMKVFRARSAFSANFRVASLKEQAWYQWWIRRQIESQPEQPFESFQDFDSRSDEIMDKTFFPVWNDVAEQILASPGTTISTIVQTLAKKGMISVGQDLKSQQNANYLVFSIIGWQTMLYRSDILSSSSAELCIVDEMNGYRGQAHMTLKHSQAACKRSLPEFLLGFGLMLPPANFCASDSPEDQKAFQRIGSTDVASFNAHLLFTIGGITIKWTDSLACHFALDIDTKTLYLFRYPSFCAANLPKDSFKPNEESVIHCIANERGRFTTWATVQDITQLLQEVILSYRLLFGQDRKARRLFRKLNPFEGLPVEGQDELLSSLCSNEFRNSTWIEQNEKDAYELKRDFPVLRSRISRSVAFLETRKPRTWRDLWLDKRDSASWLTFWTVLIFGGVGLLLALIQVILQSMQLAYQIHGP